MTLAFLDTATNSLLEELQKDFEISFETKNIDYCEVFQKNNVATVYYNPKHVDTASIAHELLHVWLTKFNYSIGNRIYLSTKSNKKLHKIFNKFLCDYITNCCDHNRMYPKFLEMGYSPMDFLKNSLEPKASLKDVKNIKIKFWNFHNSKAINHYIGSLFSILADHVENDYTQYNAILKKLDYELYLIVADYWRKWQVFDIENIDPIYISDIELIHNLIEKLTNWVTPKKIF